jgi:diaminopimelate decarboxylase
VTPPWVVADRRVAAPVDGILAAIGETPLVALRRYLGDPRIDVWAKLEMNRTQCRSTSEDFLVDPLLLRPGATDDVRPRPTATIEGYLVGAYCIERELLTWRRLRFPRGVAVGDVVVFPNTAGYQMHMLESSSHQIPLARNLVVGPELEPQLDAIESPGWG